MPNRDVNVPQLTPGQANYVLERMIRDRRISAGDVSRYVSEMQREIDELERRLQDLRAAAGGGAAPAPRRAGRSRRRPAAAPAAARPAAPSAKRNVTDSMRLQGRYLGLIRQVPENRRANFANIAKQRGREAAIREMETFLRKTPSRQASKAAPAARKRAPQKSSGPQDESRKLQGRYLSLIRQFSEGRRGQYAKIAKEKGREVAIREMQDALKK